MLEAELSKEVKKVPVIEFEIPKRIFVKQDIESGVEDSLPVKLWDFEQNSASEVGKPLLSDLWDLK